MGKNLASKALFIIAVLLVFAYGIVGIPHGGLKQSIARRINLGLDLQGGIHLVLQVHVAEAVNSETDRDVQRINEALASFGATAVKLDATEAADTDKSSKPAFRDALCTFRLQEHTVEHWHHDRESIRAPT